MRAEAEAALHAARMAVAAATEAATQAATQAAEAAAALPPLRATESDARTALERHRVAQEQIAAEEERARAALADATTRLGQLGQDLLHAEQLSRDSEAAEARLGGRGCGAGRGLLRATQARAEAAEVGGCGRPPTRSALAEAEANHATEAAAEANARAQAVARQLAEAEQRWRRLEQQFGEARAERDRIGAQAVDPAALEAASAGQTAAEAALASARDALAAAEAGPRRHRSGPRRRARAAGCGGHRRCAKLAAEANALAEVLAVKDGERWPPMVDALTVPPGLETALGAALGEELTSAADRDAARHWRELPPFDPAPKLPGGVTPLAALVDAPPALARVLSQTGLVDDRCDRRGITGRAGAGPGTGLTRRRRLALGRLHDPGRHADRGRRPAAAAQPAVAVAARPGRGAR